MQDAAATENRKLEWVDEEDIEADSNGISDTEGAAAGDDDDDEDDDDDDVEDEG